MSSDTYYTIASPGYAEFKEKGSRFIGRAMFAENQDTIDTHIHAIRKEHHDATHNCYAYRIGLHENEITRYNDDGEPSGTAGKPILQALLSFQVTNVLVIGTRYFGGTKLGTGGLIRAYSRAANEALQCAHTKECHLLSTVVLTFSYELTNMTLHTIENFSGIIIDRKYAHEVRITMAVRKSQLEAFVSRIRENTAGKIKIDFNRPK